MCDKLFIAVLVLHTRDLSEKILYRSVHVDTINAVKDNSYSIQKEMEFDIIYEMIIRLLLQKFSKENILPHSVEHLLSSIG